MPDKVVTTLLTRSGSVAELLGRYLEHGERFNMVHVSAFWITLGRHARGHPRQKLYLQGQLTANATLFAAARTQTLRMLPHIGVRELANVAHGARRSSLHLMPSPTVRSSPLLLPRSPPAQAWRLPAFGETR